MFRRFRLATALTLAALLAALAFGAQDSASASHSWGTYHWARTANPFTLKLGDNVTARWDGHLATASADWSQSPVLDTVVVPGMGGTNCSAQNGRIEVCNRKYGANGWLGLAQIWVSGAHITKGTAKMNDTYFNRAAYNTPAWRQLVMCQEIAHGFGLDHQDEAFDNPNLGTCMDYTNNPETNQHPNGHDFEQLELIYALTDSTSTLSALTAQSPAGLGLSMGGSESDWGRAIGQDNEGRDSRFEREMGNGQRVITHVFWAPSRPARG